MSHPEPTITKQSYMDDTTPEHEVPPLHPGASKIWDRPDIEKMKRKPYERELQRLEAELVRLQGWIKHEGLKVAVLFEGRDSAGKGGVIKRITRRLSPRIVHVVALPAPTERESSQWYFQRTSRTSRPPARWCCSIGVGTTAPASSE